MVHGGAVAVGAAVDGLRHARLQIAASFALVRLAVGGVGGVENDGAHVGEVFTRRVDEYIAELVRVHGAAPLVALIALLRPEMPMRA